MPGQGARAPAGQSALELARALQRVEAQAGFSRTAIAVEGDLPMVPPAPAQTSGEATVLKPVTVISGSSSRIAVEPPVVAPAQGETPSASERARLVWMVAGIAVLFAVATVLFLRAGDESSSTPPPTPGTTGTPLTIEPGAPTEPPDVTGRRTTAGVVFRWAAQPASRPGTPGSGGVPILALASGQPTRRLRSTRRSGYVSRSG